MSDGDARKVKLYADNRIFLTANDVRDAYLSGTISAEEAKNAADCLANGWGYFIENQPKITRRPDPIQTKPIDPLTIRMKLEKIPFTEAVKLMGLREALQYQFQRSR